MPTKSLHEIPPETTRNPDDELIANPRFIGYLLKQIDGKIDEQKLSSTAWQAQIQQQFKEINDKLQEIPTKYITVQQHKDSLKELRDDMDVADRGIQKQVTHINETLSKINWVVILAVIAAVLGLVLNRGTLLG